MGNEAFEHQELLERLSKRSIGVRVYWLADVAVEIGKICEETGATFSQVCNTALKQALLDKTQIAKDAKSVSERKLNGQAKDNDRSR